MLPEDRRPSAQGVLESPVSSRAGSAAYAVQSFVFFLHDTWVAQVLEFVLERAALWTAAVMRENAEKERLAQEMGPKGDPRSPRRQLTSDSSFSKDSPKERDGESRFGNLGRRRADT